MKNIDYNCNDIEYIAQSAWELSCCGNTKIVSARVVAEKILNSGGDIYIKARNLIQNESYRIGLLSLEALMKKQTPFNVIMYQFRVIAIMQYISGWDISKKQSMVNAISWLYGDDNSSIEFSGLACRWAESGFFQIPLDINRTIIAGGMWLESNVRLHFPPL